MTKHNAISLFAGFIFMALPLAVLAIEIPNPLQADTFQELIDGIINFLFQLAWVVAPLMIVIAGFIFVTGGGDPGSIQKAKNIILYTVVGFAVILLAKSLILALEEILGF